MTPATKTWPNYDRSLIGKPFYTIRMLFWPLWSYPQAFESVVFMTQNRWYLQNSKVALFSCVVLYIELTIFTLTETSALSFSQVQLYCGWQKFCLLSFALRNEIYTTLATSSTSTIWYNKQLWKPPKLFRKSRKIFSSGEVWDHILNSTIIILNYHLGCQLL